MKCLQIALLVVILGIVLSVPSTAEITAITPTTGKVGEIEIEMTVKSSSDLAKDDYLTFSTDETAAGTGTLEYKITDTTVTGPLTNKYTFDKAGTYKCVVKNGNNLYVQAGIQIVIGAKEKVVSISLLIAAVFLLF